MVFSSAIFLFDFLPRGIYFVPYRAGPQGEKYHTDRRQSCLLFIWQPEYLFFAVGLGIYQLRGRGR